MSKVGHLSRRPAGSLGEVRPRRRCHGAAVASQPRKAASCLKKPLFHQSARGPAPAPREGESPERVQPPLDEWTSACNPVCRRPSAAASIHDELDRPVRLTVERPRPAVFKLNPDASE
jgi:hypothetical protein